MDSVMPFGGGRLRTSRWVMNRTGHGVARAGSTKVGHYLLVHSTPLPQVLVVTCVTRVTGEMKRESYRLT